MVLCDSDTFDLIPPLGGWATPYNEYDCDEICAGDGDYTTWYPTYTVRRPCRSNYVERNNNKSDFARLGDTMRRLYESGQYWVNAQEYTE